MTSSNHFRGRTLAANKAATWPLRQRRRPPLLPPYPPALVELAWSIDLTNGGNHSTINARSDILQHPLIGRYTIALTDTQGHAVTLDVDVDPVTPFLNFFYSIKFTTIFVVRAKVIDSTYAGQLNYDTGVQAWTFLSIATGTGSLQAKIPWPPV